MSLTGSNLPEETINFSSQKKKKMKAIGQNPQLKSMSKDTILTLMMER